MTHAVDTYGPMKHADDTYGPSRRDLSGAGLCRLQRLDTLEGRSSASLYRGMRGSLTISDLSGECKGSERLEHRT